MFVLMIDLYFLIPAVIVQIFNPSAKLVISTGTPTEKVNAEIETHPLTTEKEIRKCPK